MSQAFWIGVNGGGTHVTARLIDRAETPRAEVFEAGPANPRTVGIERAADAIATVVTEAQAFLRTHLPAAAIDGIACGIAGTGDPARRAALIDALSRRIRGAVAVTTDAEAALFAGAARGPAVIVIAGTGSIAMGRRDDGAIVRSGGMGDPRGDPGSATRIGAEWRELMPDSTPLAESSAALAPLVARRAEEGDPIARGILDRAAADLLQMAGEVFTLTGAPAAPVAMHGGVFEKNHHVRAAFAGGWTRDRRLSAAFLLTTPPEVGAVRRVKSDGISPGGR